MANTFNQNRVFKERYWETKLVTLAIALGKLGQGFLCTDIPMC